MTWSAKWWTLTMTSVTPKVRRRERVISRRVRPESSTSALGRVSVIGRRRVPRPAARIMAFMGALAGNTPKPQRDFSLRKPTGSRERAGKKKRRVAPFEMTCGYCRHNQQEKIGLLQPE